jgi:hypothetical protein
MIISWEKAGIMETKRKKSGRINPDCGKILIIVFI